MNTQPGRNGGTLRRGGPGRPKKAQLPSRNEILERIVQREGELPGSANMLDDLITRLHELAVTSNSSATIEWCLNQLIGSPKNTVKYEVDDAAVFLALGEELAHRGWAEEEAKGLVSAVIGRLKGE